VTVFGAAVNVVGRSQLDDPQVYRRHGDGWKVVHRHADAARVPGASSRRGGEMT
jgi:hypothetical protein